jgi:hypothetical protein
VGEELLSKVVGKKDKRKGRGITSKQLGISIFCILYA